jgi:hypothetical protein
MAGGRVVVRKRHRSVDLAFKIKEKSEETGQKTPKNAFDEKYFSEK